MSYPIAREITTPLNPYEPTGPMFREKCVYDGVDWGTHLGEDSDVPAGTKVRAIARGHVVYSALHPGSEEKGNWGNVIIVAHKHPVTRRNFFSLYAHLGTRRKEKGDPIGCGELLGEIGRGFTPDNGFWEEHLHFAIYTGPWEGKILPGYWKPGSKRTKLSDWQDPSAFLAGKEWKN